MDGLLSDLEKTGSIPREDSTGTRAAGRVVRYQRFCVVEGGRYDNVVLEHRSPAQWAAPLLVAVGLTVAVEKLAALVAQTSMAPSWELHAVADPRRASSSTPDALICSTGSGLGVQGMTDRLLVVTYLWARGVRAEYMAHDVWGPRMGVDMSVEDATAVCLSLGIPFLVMLAQGCARCGIRLSRRRNEANGRGDSSLIGVTPGMGVRTHMVVADGSRVACDGETAV